MRVGVGKAGSREREQAGPGGGSPGKCRRADRRGGSGARTSCHGHHHAAAGQELTEDAERHGDEGDGRTYGEIRRESPGPSPGEPTGLETRRRGRQPRPRQGQLKHCKWVGWDSRVRRAWGAVVAVAGPEERVGCLEIWECRSVDSLCLHLRYGLRLKIRKNCADPSGVCRDARMVWTEFGPRWALGGDDLPALRFYYLSPSRC